MSRLDEILSIQSDITEHCSEYASDCNNCVAGKVLGEMHDRLREAEKRLRQEETSPGCSCSTDLTNEYHTERCFFWAKWLASLEGK